MSVLTPRTCTARSTLHHCTRMPRLPRGLAKTSSAPSSKLAMGMATSGPPIGATKSSKLRTDRMLRTVASRITLTSAARWGSCATSSSSNSERPAKMANWLLISWRRQASSACMGCAGGSIATVFATSGSRCENITHTAHRLENLRVGGVGLNLAAQAQNAQIDRPVKDLPPALMRLLHDLVAR